MYVISDGAMWASPPTKCSGGMIEMARTPKGRPYGNCFTVAV